MEFAATLNPLHLRTSQLCTPPFSFGNTPWSYATTANNS
jgi:hypothetical protein